MKKTALTLAAALALTAPLAAQPVQEQETTAERVVPVLSVQGSGSSRVDPDEATVRLGVQAQAPTAQAVMQQVNQTANAILAAVRKLGVPEKDIQTSELNLSPVYAQLPQDRGGEPRIAGYQASNVVSIRLTKLDQVGPAVDAGLGAGANRLDGVLFGLQNDQAARADALAQAAAAARTKAAALARALNVRLAEIVEVVEGGVTVFTPMRSSRTLAMESMSADTPVSSGQVGVDASLTLRYRIEPCPAQGCP
jgi:hypothetical protein